MSVWLIESYDPETRVRSVALVAYSSEEAAVEGVKARYTMLPFTVLWTVRRDDDGSLRLVGRREPTDARGVEWRVIPPSCHDPV